MDASTWKVAGIVVGGLATLVTASAKIVDERNKGRAAAENRPRSRFALNVSIVSMVLAVVGFGTALGGELATQRKAIRSAQDQAQQTQQIVLGLQRILSRFSTTFVDEKTTIELDSPRLRDLDQEILGHIKRLDGATAGDSYDGMRVVTSDSGGPSIVEFDEEAARRWSPGQSNIDWYIRSGVPKVALFKSPIDVSKFEAEAIPTTILTPTPDLVLSPVPGRTTFMLVVPDEANPTLITASVTRDVMPAPAEKWNPSTKIASLEDLDGAQAIVFMDFTQPALGNWEKYGPGTIILYFDHQPVPLNDLYPSTTKRGHRIYSTTITDPRRTR